MIFEDYSEKAGCKHRFDTSRKIVPINDESPLLAGERKENKMEQLTIVIENMEDVKREVNKAQKKACESIVEIGYILRKAEENQIYKQEGYASILDFAKEEYGWSQSQVSRFININKKYSQNGYSCVLEERYEGYGQAKLAEMLSLPDTITEELDAEMKREDIREIKRDFKAAEQEREEKEFQNRFTENEKPEGMLTDAVKQLFNQENFAKTIKSIWPYMQRYDEGDNVAEDDVKLIMLKNGGFTRAGQFMIFFQRDKLSVVCGAKKEVHAYIDILPALTSLGFMDSVDSRTWYLRVFGKEMEKPVENSEKQRKISDEKPVEPKKEEKQVENQLKSQKNNENKETDSDLTEEKNQAEPAAVPEPKNDENSTKKDEVLHTEQENQEKEEYAPAHIEQKQRKISDEETVEKKEEVIIPDSVDGVCQFCAGNKDMKCNDGTFTLHIAGQGVTRVETDGGLRFGIFEFDYCPACGKEL